MCGYGTSELFSGFVKGRKMLCSSILFTVLFSYIEAYPNGAPVTTCSSLTPVHSGAEVQRTSSPYDISVDKVGDKIKVRIFSEFGEDFRGFVLQARSSRDNKIIEGKFSETDRLTRAINCFQGIQNTLTHSDRKEKRSIVTEFVPSVELDEDIIFTATVVKTFFLFWAVNSNSIRIVKGKSGALSPTQSQQHDSTSSYHNCFIEKGCFGFPAGCTSSMNCQVLLSYTSAGSKISFTLHSRLEVDTYMAMGVSKDEKMGDDAVTACYRKDSVIELQESYNRGKRNFPNTELSRRYQTSFKNGLATCSFETNYLLEADNNVFNLQNRTYHLLLAYGPFDSVNKRLGYHSAKVASAERVNLTSFESIKALGIDDAIKVHGCFMVTAWLFFASLGIIMARQFKTAFHEKKMCNVLVWFAIHRLSMLTALILIIIALATIFIHMGGWNSATSNPHSIFGIASTCLAVIQPIMAAFRPAPDHKKRYLFNWCHFFVGNLSYILAIIAMFLAVSLESSGLKESFYYVLSIFVITHVIFHGVLQINTLKNIRSKAKNEVKMLDMSQARSNTMQNIPEKKTNEDNFRILLLGLYSIFLVVILLTMYSLIGVA